MIDSGINALNEKLTEDFGSIVPTSQFDWSKITFSRFVIDFDWEDTDVRSLFKTIST